MLRDFDFFACFPCFCRLLHFTDKLIWFGKSPHFQTNWQKFRQPVSASAAVSWWRLIISTNCLHVPISHYQRVSHYLYLHCYILSTLYLLSTLGTNWTCKCSKWRLRASPFWLLTSDLLHHSSYSQQQSLVCVRSGCLPAHSKMQQQTHSSSLFP